MQNRFNVKILYLLVLSVLVFLAVQAYTPLWHVDTKGMDIQFIYIDSQSIALGSNPYLRIHETER